MTGFILVLFSVGALLQKCGGLVSQNTDVSVEVAAPRRIFPFVSYKNAQVLQWRVPEGTKTAAWTVWANHSNLHCPSHSVDVWVKYGSVPVISADNGTFPGQMLPLLEEQFPVTVMTQGATGNVTVEGPRPGRWFMLATIRSNKAHKINKMSDLCESWLSARGEYLMPSDIITLMPVHHDYQDLHTFHTTFNKPQTYRFFAPSSAWTAQVKVTKCRVKKDETGAKRTSTNFCPISLLVRQGALPSHQNNSLSTARVNCSAVDTCGVEVSAEEDAWHYITVLPALHPLEFAVGVSLTGCLRQVERLNHMLVNKIDVNIICGSGVRGAQAQRRPLQLLFPPQVLDPVNSVCGDKIRLVRRTFPQMFMFEFVLPLVSNKSEELVLKNMKPTVLNFKLDEGDTGGTLAVEMALYSSMVVDPDQEDRSVVGCLSHGHRQLPVLAPNGSIVCSGGRTLRQRMVRGERRVVFEQVLVPFPPEGLWHLALMAECRIRGDRDRACRHSDTPVLFSIHSDSCISGTCGRYGQCYQYLSGGTMFSTCTCVAGHIGWGCNDSRFSTPDLELLVATLLLTLSNMVLLPTVVLALFRGHYTESFVYFSHLISSSLYHACHQDIYTMCVIKFSVLEFCDTFTGLMSYWITVITVAALPDTLRNLFHMAGAVGLALAVQHNRDSLLTFTLPIILGATILVISWVWHCAQEKAFFPRPGYCLVNCLPGFGLGGAGLFCLLFVETSLNHQYVHSAWHLAMGVALLLLLPETKIEQQDVADNKYVILEKRKTETFARNNAAFNKNHVRQTEVSFKDSVSFKDLPDSHNVTFKDLPDSQCSSTEHVNDATSHREDDQISQHQL